MEASTIPNFWIASLALVMIFILVLATFFLYQQTLARWQEQCARYTKINDDENVGITQQTPSFWSSLGVLYPVSDKEKKRLVQMLEHAGIHSPTALNSTRGAKLFLGLMAAVIALFWRWSQEELLEAMTVMFILISYVLGSNLPEYWLKRLSRQAIQKQQQVVPDAIDLMVISVEAGLSLERALEKVGTYLLDVEPMLANQFLRTHAEIQVRGESSECLKKLAWRTGLKELERLASTISMAERYGSPLAETMRTISDDARQMRKMALQEQAGKLPSRITLVQMALIMLPLLVLIITPTMNLLLESLR
ncbi:putative Flp pilus assembly protein TadC [Vibrio nigripulchritudo SOn1]|uniref:Flp pilus assembly protein TadC n=1 Tax=Vibrio nigripulchritudo SOn1 TaxID=1238450 RepID=A0AAV2VNZ2_9VIBR|nr:type II secretion system F family protein [Vibrio nigripulchritudo]CCO46146.1 putative Flp pilus assembly protein TadC [Vibrio nigripulchritudo SOn1]